MVRYELLDDCIITAGGYRLEVKHKPNFIERLFGLEEKVLTYQGKGYDWTVNPCHKEAPENMCGVLFRLHLDIRTEHERIKRQGIL